MKIIDLIFYIFSLIFTEYIFIYNYGTMTNKNLKLNIKNIITIIIFSLFTYINNYYNLVFL